MVCDKGESAGLMMIPVVLILLFLEYGLRPIKEHTIGSYITGLNPTFSGIWSATITKSDITCHVDGLNPTFSGIWSATICSPNKTFDAKSLNPTFSGIWSATGMYYQNKTK